MNVSNISASCSLSSLDDGFARPIAVDDLDKEEEEEEEAKEMRMKEEDDSGSLAFPDRIWLRMAYFPLENNQSNSSSFSLTSFVIGLQISSLNPNCSIHSP